MNKWNRVQVRRERKKEKENNIEVRRTWKEVVKREMADKKSESKGRRETWWEEEKERRAGVRKNVRYKNGLDESSKIRWNEGRKERNKERKKELKGKMYV